MEHRPQSAYDTPKRDIHGLGDRYGVASGCISRQKSVITCLKVISFVLDFSELSGSITVPSFALFSGVVYSEHGFQAASSPSRTAEKLTHSGCEPEQTSPLSACTGCSPGRRDVFPMRLVEVWTVTVWHRQPLDLGHLQRLAITGSLQICPLRSCNRNCGCYITVSSSSALPPRRCR